MREMLRVLAEELMGAEADAICGAGYGQRSDERVNRRNGYRELELDTRVGTMPLPVPKLREGSYYPDWLLENRRRAERALVAVIAECYMRGVSTRRVDGLVKMLGIEGISKSQVSRLAKTLDEEVAAFRSRPLDGESYPYLWADALAIRVREGGRVVKVVCIAATAVNSEGRREIVGLDTFTEETEGVDRALARPDGAEAEGVRLVVFQLPQGTRLCNRGGLARCHVAGGPYALHAKRAVSRAEVGAAVRGHTCAYHLRAAECRRGGRHARGCDSRHHGVFDLPGRTLAPDLV